MIDIEVTNKTQSNNTVLSVLLRTLYPAEIAGSGCSYVNSTLYYHANDDITQIMQDEITAILQGHYTLAVASDKSAIASDNVEEAVITCVELPTTFDYNVYSGIDIVLSGSVDDGSLEFSTNVPGRYTIEIKEQGAYRTGYINLEVV